MMQLLDGKALATKILADIKGEVATLETPPMLVVVMVGHDPASEAYVRQKKLAAETCGIRYEEIHYPETVTTEELLLEIARLNSATDVTGFIVQLPLPRHVDKNAILTAVSPAKDVDGFHPLNLGKVLAGLPDALPPATPAGVMRLLDTYDIELEGKDVVVVGHSNIVGKPMVMMLANRNATVTVCHQFTKNLAAYTRDADIVISATGVVGLIKPAMVKDGVVVVDVGIVRVGNRLVGDVEFEGVAAKASAITPVPGGVGPMTVAILIENVLKCMRQNALYRRSTDV